MTTKPLKISQLIKEADKWFSEFIRLRDCEAHTGMANCSTCDARVYWRKADCCHFLGRGNMVTRWDEMNAALGCVECNRFMPLEHHRKLEKFLIDKYGIQDISAMQEYAHIGLKKWMPFEIEELIISLKSKVSALRKAKGL